MTIVLYTNILTPYRQFLFDKLYDLCKQNNDRFFVLVMSDTEGNRSWKYSDFEKEYCILLKHKTMYLKSAFNGAYIHFNPDLMGNISKLNPNVVICSGSMYCPGVWKLTSKHNKKKYNYISLFWGESHLDEIRNYNKVKYRVREIIRKRFFKRIDGAVYPGCKAKELFDKYCAQGYAGFQLPNVIDERVFENLSFCNEADRTQLRNAYRIPLNKKILLIPARLEKVKGISEFYDLLNRIDCKNSFAIVIAGDGSLRSEIREKGHSYNIETIFLGSVKQSQMVDLYKCSDVVVLPSLSDPNPLTCIEALCAGKALLVSKNVGNYPEVIKNGENGFAFDYSNVEAATNIIAKIIQLNNDWYLNAFKVSRDIFLNMFDSSKVVSKFLQNICSFVEHNC